MFFRRAFLLALYKLSDIVILICSFALAIMISGHQVRPSTFSHFLSVQVKVQNILIMIILILSWYFVFKGFGLYRSRRFRSKLQECVDVLKATTIGTCIVTALFIVSDKVILTSSFVLSFWLISTLSTLTARTTMRIALLVVRNMGRNLRLVVIVGTNQRVQSLAKIIRKRKDSGYKIIGFVDNECIDHRIRPNLLSDLDHFSEVLERHVLDEVIIGLPVKSFYEKISEIIWLCEEQGIVVRFLTDMLFDLRVSKSRVDHFLEFPILTFYTAPLDGKMLWIKRSIDFVFSAIALLLLFPLFIVVGILVKLDSSGPVFFVQERVGYNKRRLKVCKFRTMIKDAEMKQAEVEHLNEMSGAVFKIKNDPRITRVGRILRKTTIDELPQLFNVLKGDMSLVGPRPLPVRDYERFDKEWQKRRFSVKPGLTCLWQVNGRSQLPFQNWMQLDMEYIDNWSLLLDLKIILKTVPAVLRGLGAM